jgi:hypothetical protein
MVVAPETMSFLGDRASRFVCPEIRVDPRCATSRDMY